MKSIFTTFSVALALAASLLTAEAQAHGGGGHSGGGHSGGHSSGSHSMHANHSRPGGSSHNSHSSTAHNFHQTNFNSLNKLGQSNKLNAANSKNFASKLNFNKSSGKGFNKNFAKSNYKGMNKKWFPGKSWWGHGGYGWGGWYGWGGYGYDGYCGDYCSDDCPWYYSACYNVCSDYVPGACSCDCASVATDFGPIPTPAARIVRIVNPAETQTTLGFAVNDQNYSLEAGQTQDVELADSTVIEFDRGSGNDTARYSLSEGVYHFASTPQGWELFRSNDAPLDGAVAAN